MGLYNLTKRWFDFVGSLLLLLAFAPIFLFLMILLFLFNQGSVFFLQERPGLNGKIFKIIKFRTMSEERDREGRLLPEAERIRKTGKWIRKSSLDELPQLLNVLMGEMSLVGPRPLLVEYLDRYNETQQRRHLVYPGITGWAQINVRNGISWEEKFELDVWYVDHRSFLLDMKILYKTISPVVEGKAVNQEGYVSMERFKGMDQEV